MKSGQRGFNVYELMLALTITGILMAFGVPSLRDMTLRQRVTASTQDLQLDLTLARQEAITRGSPVSVCTSADGVACSNDGWSQSRIVFADPNSNGTLDVGEEAIKYTTAFPDGLTADSVTPFLTFTATGSVAAPTDIVVCKPGFIGRTLHVKRTGHPMIETMVAVCP